MRARAIFLLSLCFASVVAVVVWLTQTPRPAADRDAPTLPAPDVSPKLAPAAEQAPAPRLVRTPDDWPTGQALTGAWRARLGLRGPRVNSLAFTPDGERLLSGTWGGLNVWNLRTGQLERTVPTGNHEARILALSRDGSTLATTGPRDELLLWDLRAETRRPLKAPGDVTAAAFTADGRTVFALHGETVCRWDVADGTRTGTSESVAWEALALTPDGKTVAVVGKRADPKTSTNRNEIVLLSGETLKETRRLRGHANEVRALRLSPDGKTLAALESGAAVVRLWDISTGTEVRALKCGRDERLIVSTCREMAFSPSGRYLVATGLESSMWEVATGAQVAQLADERWESSGLSFSPDGTMVATGVHDARGLVLWDVLPVLNSRTVTGPKEHVLAAVAPGAKTALLRSDRREVASADLWNLTTGARDRTLSGWMPAGVGDPGVAAFSPDGKRLARRTADERVLVADPGTGETTTALKPENDPTALAFRSDGRRLAVATRQGCEIWSVEAAEPKRLFEIGAPRNGAGAVAFSPDDRALAVGVGYSLLLADAATGRTKWVVPAHEKSVRTVAFSSDGAHILSTADWDQAVRVWDAATGRAVAVLRHDDLAPGANRHREPPTVRLAFFGPDAGTVVTLTGDGRFHLWDVATAGRLGDRLAPTGDHGCELAPDRRAFVTASETEFRVWDVATFGRAAFARAGAAVRDPFTPRAGAFVPARATREVLGGYGHFVAYSADGTRLVAANATPGAVAWDEKTGKELKRQFFRPQEKQFGYALSPDGTRLARTFEDSTARTFDVATGEEVLKLVGHTGSVRCTAFSPDGKRLATGNGGPELILWDAKTGGKVKDFVPGGSGWIDSIAFSPDGKWLVACGLHRASVFDVETGTERRLKTNDYTSVAAVSRDGRLIALDAGDRGSLINPTAVTVWDAATGKLVYTLPHDGKVTSLAFGSDGLLAVAAWGDGGGGDGTTSLWNANTGTLLTRLPREGPLAISPDGKTLARHLKAVELIDLTFACDPTLCAPLAPALRLGWPVALDGDVVRVGATVRGPDSIAALEALAAFPRPLSLQIEAGDGFPEAAVSAVTRCKALHRLAIRSDALTDGHLEALAGLSGLKSLDLTRCDGVTAEGMGALAKLDRLTRLVLADTKVTDAGIARLKGLAKLTELDLANTGVTDASLAHLAGLKSLRKLRVSGTGMTAKGLEGLKGQSLNVETISDRP